jgi:hypothetical protein
LSDYSNTITLTAGNACAIANNLINDTAALRKSDAKEVRSPFCIQQDLQRNASVDVTVEKTFY